MVLRTDELSFERDWHSFAGRKAKYCKCWHCGKPLFTFGDQAECSISCGSFTLPMNVRFLEWELEHQREIVAHEQYMTWHIVHVSFQRKSTKSIFEGKWKTTSPESGSWAIAIPDETRFMRITSKWIILLRSLLKYITITSDMPCGTATHFPPRQHVKIIATSRTRELSREQRWQSIGWQRPSWESHQEWCLLSHSEMTDPWRLNHWQCQEMFLEVFTRLLTHASIAVQNNLMLPRERHLR